MSFQQYRKRNHEYGDGMPSKRKKFRSAHQNEDNVKCELLSYENIIEGMVILGCVTEIREKYFLCSLPGCLIGKVSCIDISDKYSDKLQNSEELEKNQIEPSLHSIIKLGMVIPCKVMSITLRGDNKPPLISLSINPQTVNEGLERDSLYKKMVLHGSVASFEDHGYLLDLGIDSLQGFISCGYISKDKQLKIGQIVPTYVLEIPRSISLIVQLVPLSFEDPFPTVMEENVKLSSLLPGACINAFVTQIKHHIALLSYQNFDACASLLSVKHTAEILKTSELKCQVLYIHPITHVIYVHLGATPTPKTFSSFFGLNKFDLVRKCSFRFWLHNKGYCSFNLKYVGFFKKTDFKRNCNISENDLDNVPIPKALVQRFHYMDNLVELNLNKKLTNEKKISPSAAEIGNVYEGYVKKHLEYGMIVNVCAGFTGYVKKIHMSDTKINLPIAVRFPVGTKVCCKVVANYPNSKPYFSIKESLMNLKSSEMLASYEDAHKGMCFKGVVKSINDQNVHVLFFQDVQGFISVQSLPKDCVLFEGQTVTSEVICCNPKIRLLRLSLQNEGCKFNIEREKRVAEIKLSSTERKKKNYESKENKLSEESNEFLFPVEGSKKKALITAAAETQLFLEMPGGAHGRVHVTELGCTEEDAYPYKGFLAGQYIDVYVIEKSLKKKHFDLPISNRRFYEFFECSLCYPPPISLSETFKPGMQVLGFVKEVDEFRSTLWISPKQTASLEHINYVTTLSSLRKLKCVLRKGLSVAVSVLEVQVKGKQSTSISLTKLGDLKPAVGSNIYGRVQVTCAEKGVTLTLPNGYSGFVNLTDLQDIYMRVNNIFDKLQKRKFILCHVLQVNHTTKFCMVSLRHSRLYKKKITNSETFCPELTFENIKCEKIVKGFVKLVLDKSLVVSLGRGLDGKVKLHKCRHNCLECERSLRIQTLYPVGNVVNVIINEIKSNGDLCDLSLVGPKTKHDVK